MIGTERGAAVLGLTVTMCLGALLAWLLAVRPLAMQQRGVTTLARAAQAGEAADAGLDWALAQLNAPAPLRADCSHGGKFGVSFRQLYLGTTTETGLVQANRRVAGCVHDAHAWSCDCPARGMPELPAPGDDDAPAFSVRFEGTATPGAVRIIAIGCTRPAGPCGSAAGAADAQARHEIVARLQGSTFLRVKGTWRDSG